MNSHDFVLRYSLPPTQSFSRSLSDKKDSRIVNCEDVLRTALEYSVVLKLDDNYVIYTIKSCVLVQTLVLGFVRPLDVL